MPASENMACLARCRSRLRRHRRQGHRRRIHPHRQVRACRRCEQAIHLDACPAEPGHTRGHPPAPLPIRYPIHMSEADSSPVLCDELQCIRTLKVCSQRKHTQGCVFAFWAEGAPMPRVRHIYLTNTHDAPAHAAPTTRECSHFSHVPCPLAMRARTKCDTHSLAISDGPLRPALLREGPLHRTRVGPA